MLKLPAAVPIEEAEWGPGGKDAGQNGETDLDPRCSAIDAWYQRQESVAADPGNAKKTPPRGRGLKVRSAACVASRPPPAARPRA